MRATCYNDLVGIVSIDHKIAQADKPIPFHSGILYGGTNASGNYNGSK